MVQFQSIRPGVSGSLAAKSHGNVCFCGCKNNGASSSLRFGADGASDSFVPSNKTVTGTLAGKDLQAIVDSTSGEADKGPSPAEALTNMTNSFLDLFGSPDQFPAEVKRLLREQAPAVAALEAVQIKPSSGAPSLSELQDDFASLLEQQRIHQKQVGPSLAKYMASIPGLDATTMAELNAFRAETQALGTEVLDASATYFEDLTPPKASS